MVARLRWAGAHNNYRELKTARSHKMPPPLHLSDIRIDAAMASKKAQWTNGRMKVTVSADERRCMNEKNCCKNYLI